MKYLFLLASIVVGPLQLMAQTYTNIAGTQGLNVEVSSDAFGSGMSFYDFDDDGWDDLTFAVSNDSLVFYRNVQGQMQRLPSFIYAAGETKHVLWVDYDNDGDLDLMVTTWFGTYRLYANDGAFNFIDVSLAAGLAQNDEKTMGVSWGDYDRDGDLDLYVCIYEFIGDQTTFERFNHLYRNNGNGSFTDVTYDAGLVFDLRASFQAVWLDHDKDGWPDLYVINDRFFANSLYHNNGDGTFTDIAAQTGSGIGQNPMSASVADFENDGDLDIYMTNTGPAGNDAMLLVNGTNGVFTEEAGALGVALPIWGWGATWVDHDNDTWQDLYVTTGFPAPPDQYNVFYRSNQGSFFTPAPELFTGDLNARSFAVGRGDLNNDGYYDLAVQNQNPWQPFLWQNSGGANNYVKITLRGTVSNRFAIGSWIRVYAGGRTFTQYTHCGENYLGQNSQHHIFGMAANILIDSVEVEYVSGYTDHYYDIPVNTSYLFTEGETYNATLGPLGDTIFCEGGSVVIDAGEHTSYLWNSGDTTRYLTVTNEGDHWVTVTNAFGLQAGSDTIHVTVHPVPLIEANTQNPPCSGDPSGSIELVNIIGTPAASIAWSTGQEGASLDGLIAGEYTYLFTDTNGCIASTTVDLVDPPELFLQIVPTPMISGNDGSITVFAFGGVPPYVITLNGSIITGTASNLAAGTFSVLVTDAQGCTLLATTAVDDHTSISDPYANGTSVHPNPVGDHLALTTDIDVTRMWVTSADSRIALRIADTRTRILDVGALAPGWYVLHLAVRNASSIRIPFVKQ